MLQDRLPTTAFVLQTHDRQLCYANMQVGSFELKVRRNIAGGKGSSAATSAHVSAPAPAHNQEVAVAPAMASVDVSVMESIDESLMPVLSPKVRGSCSLKQPGSDCDPVIHLHYYFYSQTNPPVYLFVWH